MGTAKTSDPNPGHQEADRQAWLATLRRLKEDCQFDEYRKAVVGSRFADTAAGHLELARLELHRNDPEAALTLLDELVDREPGFAPATAWRIATLDRLYRFDDALKVADAASDRHPDSIDVHVSVARLHSGRGRDREALAAIDTALELGPTDTSALAWRTRILSSTRRRPEAERSAREALEASPSSRRLLMELGWLLWLDGRAAEALAEFDRVLDLDASHAPALEWRVTALRGLFRRDEAEAAVRAAIDLRPLVPDLHLELGLTLEDQGRYEEALAAIDQAIDLCPGNPSSATARTRVLQQLRRWPAAEDAARELVAQFPRIPDCYVDLGAVLDDLDRFEQALEAFEQALAIDDRHSNALQWKATALRELRRWDEAEAAARDLITKHPNDPNSHISLGWVLAGQDRDEEALAAYEQASAIDHRHSDALQWRVTALGVLRRRDEAEAAARDLIAKHPNDPDSHIHLGWVLAGQDRDEEALAAYEQALAIDHRHSDALQWKAGALRFLRRWDEAEETARDLITKHPSDPDSHIHLGWVLAGQDRDEEALTAYEQALAIDDRHSNALQWKAAALRFLRRWDEAEETARDLITKHSNDPDSHIHLGWVLAGQDRDEEALAAYEKAVATQDTHIEALIWRVRGLRALRRWDEAAAAAHDLVAKHRHQPQAHVNLGWVFYDQARDEEALAAYEEALHADPGHTEALEWKVFALCSLDRLSEAETASRQALTIHPRAPELHVGLGEVFSRRGLYETALTHAERALQIAPTLWRARSFYITCLVDLRRFVDAEAALRDYVAENPQAVPARLRLAEILDIQHRYEESLAEYEHVRTMDLHNSDVMSGISATLRSLRCFREAEACLRTALQRNPRNTELSMNLGLVYLDQQDLKAATEVFEGLLADASGRLERSSAHYGLGWIALANEGFGEAAAHFEKAAKFTPEKAEGFVAKAWALMRVGDRASFDEAETICRNVLRKHPHASLAHTCLGMIAYHRDEFSVAEHHFRRCIDLSPYDGCHVDLGALYTQLGRYEEAEASLRRAIELNPWDTQASVKLGSLFLQRSDRFRTSDTGTADIEAACTEFRRVLAANPRNGAAALGLAVALASHRTGDLSAAEDVLRTALNANVTDIPAWQLRLALARLLIQVGDATQQSEPYDTAVLESTEAIKKAGNEAEPYFVAGIAEQRLAGQSGNVRLRVLHQRRAHVFFGKCVERSPDHSEANHAMRLLKQQKAMARASEYRGALVVGTACLLLAAMWTDFLWKHHVTAVMITTLTPVLIGLMAIGLIMPLLIRLKLPGGMEADLSASLDALSAGPPGHIVINAPRLPPIGSPSGQLPRLTA